VTGATLALASSITKDACEMPHVLDGLVLDGAAGRLARILERGFLDEAGWDPRTRVLSLPTQHRPLGRQVYPGRRVCAHRPQWSARGVSSILHEADPTGDERGGHRRRPSVASSDPACGSLRGAGMPVRANGAPRGVVRAACQELPPPTATDVDGQFLANPRVRPLRRCRRARWRRAPGRPMARAATATPHCQRWRTAHHSNLQQPTEPPVVDAVRPTWSPEAPDSRPAMSTWGMPPRPNPPTDKLTPSVMSARASRALAPPCSSCPVRSLINRSWQPHRLAAVSWTLRAPNTAAVPLRDGGPRSRRARGRPGAPWSP
jgi:hypothetical protein